MFFDQATVRSLEWDEIRVFLAQEALTPQGASACRSLCPIMDLIELQKHQQRFRQLSRLVEEDRPPPLQAIEDIEEDLVRAGKHGTLPAEAILRVAQVMVVSSRLREYLLREGGETCDALGDLARGSHPLLYQGRELLEAFDATGLLRDSASPALADLRRSARHLADAIRKRLEQIIAGPRASLLMEPLITQRGDRYVLPVRSDSRSSMAGIVHDTSLSGATLFIEPAELIEDGNRLKIARAAAQEEEQRILASYTREIGEQADALRDNLRCLIALDVLWAGVKLGRRFGGQLIEIQGTGFDLRQAVHPLMALDQAAAPSQPVGNDIRLPEVGRCLLITGPNAGGKTVALKIVGLASLMTQSGLPFPAAEGSRIGAYASLHAVIGDEQDLRRGLSTFSGHMERIGNILKRTQPDTLVLLDEVAADTEPRHGAALARAVLEALVRQGATVVVTTHFEELKQLPLEDPSFVNASVGFDMQRLEPTFALHPDLPGRSLTFDIARRLGLGEEVLQAAAAHLGNPDQRLDQLLSSLQEDRQALAATRDALQQQQSQLQVDSEQCRALQQELEHKRQELTSQGKKQLQDELHAARRKVAEQIELLKKTPSMKQAVVVSESLKTMEADFKQEVEHPIRTDASAVLDAASKHQPEAGDRVFLPSLGQTGEVTSVDRKAGMITVRLGSLQTRVPFEQARPVAAMLPKKRQAPSPISLPQHLPQDTIEARTTSNTLDLRGLRVDEALEAVDRFLDKLFAAGETAAFLVHGHGTGALKSALRDYLRQSPYLRHFRSGTLGEGGDGVTIARLK